MSATAPHATGLRTAAVGRWLCDIDPSVRPPLQFESLGNGKSNITVSACDASGRRWVLRRRPFGHVAQSAHDVVREQSIIARLSGTGVPVPRVLGVTDDPRVSEVPLVLLEHIDGIVIDTDTSMAAVPRPIRRQVGPSLAQTLARIHAVDLTATGLADLASHKPYAPRQLRRWLRQWQQARTRASALVEEVAETLLARAPAERSVSLVHGDYHLKNVILDAYSGEIRAIVDWELATLGDPLADLGLMLAYWPRDSDDPVAALVGTAALPDGFATDEELIEVYARSSGRSVEPVRYWQALGYWKIAIIAEGVRRRAVDDPRNGTPLAADAIDAVVERARVLLSQDGR